MNALDMMYTVSMYSLTISLRSFIEFSVLWFMGWFQNLAIDLFENVPCTHEMFV